RGNAEAYMRTGSPAQNPAVTSRRALGAVAVGAFACGALAVGALAIGALAINRLAVRRGRIRSLEIGELRVGQLRVARSSLPAYPESRGPLTSPAPSTRTPAASRTAPG